MPTLDITGAISGDNKGLSVWRTETGFQVSVKHKDGSFVVGIAATAQDALQIALGGKIQLAEINFEDLL